VPLTAAPATLPTHVRAAPGPCLALRLAVYGGPLDPPVVEELRDPDPAILVEAAVEAIADRSPLPAPAVREVVENLVHAGFADAVVSVLDGGFTLRVADHGPGIGDPGRALLPGFTAAAPATREMIRGVGSGLPLAAAMLEAAGGRMEIAENLGGGTVVTLSLPAPAAPAPEPVCSEAARVILALLLEVGSARPAELARELGRGRAECGRELAVLWHRGLVARDPGGGYRLTEAGTTLVATLF